MELTKSWWLHSINAVLQYDFTNLRNSALLSDRCIYLLIFKKICNQISLCSRLDHCPSHQNQVAWKCWYFSLRTTLLRLKMEDEAWRSNGDSRDRKGLLYWFLLLLFVTWDSFTLPCIQSRTLLIVKNHHPRRMHTFLIQRRTAPLLKSWGCGLHKCSVR